MYQTHGDTYLVLLPSGSDTLHKSAIVLALRQKLVYNIFTNLASLSFAFLEVSLLSSFPVIL